MNIALLRTSNPGLSTKTELWTLSNSSKKHERRTCSARNRQIAEPRLRSGKPELRILPNPDSSTYQNQTANQLNPPKIPNFEPTNRVGPNTTLALMKIKLKSTWFTMSKPLIHRGLCTLILPSIIEYLGNYQWHWNILVSLLVLGR